MIDLNDVDIQIFPASQHGMLTGRISGGIKAIHKPTGLFVVCNEFRSQHKNRSKALNDLEYEIINKKQ